jgi:hypothetical protein
MEKRQSLKTVNELREAIEDLYHNQRTGKLDAKAADALNTTMKTAVYLNVKLPMDAFKLYVQAQIKKVSIPEGLRRALPIPVD